MRIATDLLIAASLSCAVAPLAHAQTAHGIGIALESCGSWTAENQHHDLNWLGHIAWLGGYISAYNVFASKTGDLLLGTDMPGAQGWMDNYCKDHPLDLVALAAYQLMVELEARHLREKDLSH